MWSVVFFYVLLRMSIFAFQKFNSDVLGKVLFLLILVRVHCISRFCKLMFSILFVNFPFITSTHSFLPSSHSPLFLGPQLYIYWTVWYYSSDFFGSVHFSLIILSPFFGLGNFYSSNFNFTDSGSSILLLRSFYKFLFKLYFSSLKISFLR